MPPLSHLTSCTPTKSNLYLANLLAAAVSEPVLYSLQIFHVPNLMSPFLCLFHTKYQSRSDAYCMNISQQDTFLPWLVVSTSPNSKLGDNPLSALCDCLFNILAAALHTGAHYSIGNLRSRQAEVTGTHLSPHFQGTRLKIYATVPPKRRYLPNYIVLYTRASSSSWRQNYYNSEVTIVGWKELSAVSKAVSK